MRAERSSRLAAALVAALAAAPAVGPAAWAQQSPTPGASAPSASATTQAPAPDQARGVDAELRIALFELLAGDDLAALARLRHLERSDAAFAGAEAGGATRADVRYLLAQSYRRLGVEPGFRAAAEQVIADPQGARYASLLRAQLLLDAHARGDNARAAELARSLEGSELGGLASLVAGLTAYETGSLQDASAAFARVSDGTYAPYARYMGALATLRADTSRGDAALETLRALATSAPAPLADQARLTGAQLAYEMGRFEDALALAGQVAEASALAPQALLTRAWALYRSGQVAPAAEAFADFASRHPSLPERDESRLMAAQAYLQLGRTVEAETLFREVADSAAAESAALQGDGRAALDAAARTIVAQRAASIVAIGDPATAKALALRGADETTLALAAVTPAAATGAVDAPALDPIGRPVGSLASDSLVAALPAAFPRRVLFSPASATRTPSQIVQESQALADADATITVTRQQLAAETEGTAREIALLEALDQRLAGESGQVAALAAELRVVRDSLARLETMMAGVEARVRELLGGQIQGTRQLARENLARIDSLRTTLGPMASAEELAAVAAEATSAAAYARVAEVAEQGLTAAIARHPTFATRDSVRAHASRADAALAEMEGSYTGTRRRIAETVANLRSTGGARIAALRETLAGAESRRSTLEQTLAASVSAELSARVAELVEGLQRDAEAAQFGNASAAFFRAIDDTRAIGAATPTPGNDPGAARSRPAGAPAPAPRQR